MQHTHGPRAGNIFWEGGKSQCAPPSVSHPNFISAIFIPLSEAGYIPLGRLHTWMETQQQTIGDAITFDGRKPILDNSTNQAQIA